MSADRWAELDRIFASARQLPADRRGEFVARECREDETLRREALTLLAAAEASSGFMEAPALDQLAQSVAAEGWALRPGERIGAYVVVGLLGSGGSGEVWRARDERLGRDVAIKTLLPHLMRDADRLHRFTEEARSAGALNHSNVLTVYDVGEHHGIPFIVSECLDGQSLRQRLDRGALPPAEALRVALDVARGLAAAHARGIVHRDLKPENTFIRSDGVVKILDFGLAKLKPDIAGPLIEPRHTLTGVILGTAAYMAPEQIRGEAVDTRADLFALGVMLYEMLWGRHPFRHATIVETMNAVLTLDPHDVSALSVGVPPTLSGVVMRLLHKAPDARFQSASAVVWALEQVASAFPSATTVPRFVHPSREWPSTTQRQTAAWIASLVGAAAAGALVTHLLAPEPQTRATTLQLSIPFPPGQQVASVVANPTFAFSPDGSSLVVPVLEGGRSWLVRRHLSSPGVQRIEGTDDGTTPFFSPDGAWLGFRAGGKLMKVARDGGRPFVLADQQHAGGAAWGSDGRVVFPRSASDGLFRVPANGGPLERLTAPDRARGELGHWWPQILPGGKAVIFTGWRSPLERSRVGVVSVETREVRDLVDSGFFGRYVSSGHLLFVRGGRLYAAPFDPERAEVTGPAQSVLDDVFVGQTDAGSFLDVSVDGTLAWIPATVADPLQEMLWVHRDGRTAPAAGERRRYRGASLSPDGRTIATAIQEHDIDVWTYSLERGTLSRVTTGPDAEFGPAWSRDGKTLFWHADRPFFEIQRIPFGNSGEGEPLWTAEADTTLTGLAPDGRGIVYTVLALETRADVWVGSVDGSDPARPFRATPHDEQFGSFSPDGRWLAYESNETGRPEIYVEAFPGPGDRFQVSADGGTEPFWTHGSGEIFYRRGEEMRVVRARTSPGLTFEPPQTLFRLASSRSGYRTRNYDVTPDGQRVLVARVPDELTPRRIDLVTGWLDELTRRVPTRR